MTSRVSLHSLLISAFLMIAQVAAATNSANCKVFHSQSTCNICKKGFYPDAQGQCQPITIANCDQIDTQSNCVLCGNGVLVKDGKCDTSTNCADPNCDLCAYNNDREQKCLRCNLTKILRIDESLKYGECVTRSADDDSNCIALAQLSDAGYHCFLCNEGFSLTNNKCIGSTQNQISEISLRSSALVWRYNLVALILALFLW